MKLGGLYKTEDIIKLNADATLSSALSLLQSSHDAVFVFEDPDSPHAEFIGVVNPYYCLIKKSYPANTRVRNCLMNPPHLLESDTLEKAAQQMMESKIHYLPVFRDQKEQTFAGIISARRLLKHIKDSEKFSQILEHRTLKGKKLVTVKDTAPLSRAMNMFKQHRISKLVVISATGKLEGVLSYYDIINHLSAPRERQNFASRTGDKHPFLKKPVKNFYKKNVLTMSTNNTYSQVIHEILEKGIGSVVIVNKKNEPLGIVTTKDILSMYAAAKPRSGISLNAGNLSKGSRTLAELFAKRFNQTLGKRDDIEKAEVTISEKNQGGIFKAAFSVFQKGERKVVKEEGKDLSSVLQSLKLKVRRLLSH